MNIDDYSIVRAYGLWWIGRVTGKTLRDAFELQCLVTQEGGRLDVRYMAAPALLMADIDELPIDGVAWAVRDMPKGRRDKLARIVEQGEMLRRQMKAQDETGLTLVGATR